MDLRRAGSRRYLDGPVVVWPLSSWRELVDDASGQVTSEVPPCATLRVAGQDSAGRGAVLVLAVSKGRVFTHGDDRTLRAWSVSDAAEAWAREEECTAPSKLAGLHDEDVRLKPNPNPKPEPLTLNPDPNLKWPDFTMRMCAWLDTRVPRPDTRHISGSRI